jgi:hypothetical protein
MFAKKRVAKRGEGCGPALSLTDRRDCCKKPKFEKRAAFRHSPRCFTQFAGNRLSLISLPPSALYATWEHRTSGSHLPPQLALQTETLPVADDLGGGILAQPPFRRLICLRHPGSQSDPACKPLFSGVRSYRWQMRHCLLSRHVSVFEELQDRNTSSGPSPAIPVSCEYCPLSNRYESRIWTQPRPLSDSSAIASSTK